VSGRRGFLVLAALVAVWLVACGFLFVWPEEDSPSRADAVVVLAGDAEYRVPRGLELVRRGLAGRLLLSREPGPKWARWRRLCRRPAVTCFTADPYSTQGEAEAVARIAMRRGLQSVAVVTSRYHVFRTRLLFGRCLDRGVSVVGARYDRRWLPVVLPLETGKLVWALAVDRRC
jgi:uncharacterized SAM-binding protein YcdF (DUF218 family)